MGVGGGWTGVFLTARAPGCFPRNPESRAWTGVGAVATPSRRVPLCELPALGGGWCRPPAAPSSGGGGAAPEQSRPSPAASREPRPSARGLTLSTPGWEFGSLARVHGAPSGWGPAQWRGPTVLRVCGRSRSPFQGTRFQQSLQAIWGSWGFGDSAR